MPLALEQNPIAALTYDSRGYLMIERLQVENFRCFKSVSIEGLKRVNIIVGKNASGKTVLLESIKLGLDGLPEKLPWLNQLRNMPMIFPQNPTPEQFESLFVDLFHLFESQEIIISIGDSQNRTSEVRIQFDPSKATTIQLQLGFALPEMTPSAPPTTIIPLAFNRRDFKGEQSTLLVTLSPQGQLLFQPGKPMGIVSGLISVIYFGGPGENATILSQLDIEKRSVEVKEAIRLHFPFISDVTSETPTPGMGVVYADIPTLSRKIPLSLISGGISRLFTMMLCIVKYKGGVVLIDEIENGIYFEQYERVWKSLFELAKHHDTQLFISTHSMECLRSLLPTIKGNEEDFLLLRVEKENGSSKITPIAAKFIEAAIEQGFDVR